MISKVMEHLDMAIANIVAYEETKDASLLKGAQSKILSARIILGAIRDDLGRITK